MSSKYEIIKTKVNGIEKKIALVDMRNEEFPYYSKLVLAVLKKYFKENKKVLIIYNRKGYDSGIICRNCGHIPQCKNCSIPITFYKLPNGEKIGMCNICKTQYEKPLVCPKCGSPKLLEYGLGIQKIAENMKNFFGVKSYLLYSEKINSLRKIEKTLKEIKNYNLIIGTSLTNTPIKGIIFDLIVYLNADNGLFRPEIDSYENNFRFLYEGIKKHKTKNYIIQTYNPNVYSIQSAIKLDLKDFLEHELKFREQNNYPPFSQMIYIMYKTDIEESLRKKINKTFKELLFLQNKLNHNKIEIYPTPPIIYKVFGKFHYNILIKGEGAKDFVKIAFEKLKLQQRGFKIDEILPGYY